MGGGHNGLVCAAYLARAGAQVSLLERRSLLGGACVTEELWPGFRVSRAAYVVGLMRPIVMRELRLRDHGLRLLPRDPSSFTPLPDGRSLLMGSDADETHREIERFSPRDARRYPEYEAFLDRIAHALEPFIDAPAPDPARLGLRDLQLLGRVGWRARRIGADLPSAFALLLGAARPTLER